MKAETLETLSLCSVFVVLLGIMGFLVAIILNALTFYVRAPSNQTYDFFVSTQLLSITSFPNYILASVLFAFLGLFILYQMKK